MTDADRIAELEAQLKDSQMAADLNGDMVEAARKHIAGKDASIAELEERVAELEAQLQAARGLASTYQSELHRCRTAENHAAAELDRIRAEHGISRDVSVEDAVLAERKHHARELTQLAIESVQRSLTLARLEAEVVASRDLVQRAEARAAELEGLVRAYREACDATELARQSLDVHRHNRFPRLPEKAIVGAASDASAAEDASRAALFAAVPENTNG